MNLACAAGLPNAFARQQVARGVDVWGFELDSIFTDGSGWETLSGDERARAQRFATGPLRERFVRGRAALRRILGSYLDRHPRDVRFTYGPYGKPRLDAADARDQLEFNVSHSGGAAVVAVAHGREVGIDLEQMRPDFDLDAIVARFFSPAERLDFAAVPVELKPAAFYRAWTCKEAYLKALGAGLHLALDDFAVDVDPRRPARLVRPHASAVESYEVHALPAPSGYAGAVAVSAAPHQ